MKCKKSENLKKKKNQDEQIVTDGMMNKNKYAHKSQYAISVLFKNANFFFQPQHAESSDPPSPFGG